MLSCRCCCVVVVGLLSVVDTVVAGILRVGVGLGASLRGMATLGPPARSTLLTMLCLSSVLCASLHGAGSCFFLALAGRGVDETSGIVRVCVCAASAGHCFVSNRVGPFVEDAATVVMLR